MANNIKSTVLPFCFEECLYSYLMRESPLFGFQTTTDQKGNNSKRTKKSSDSAKIKVVAGSVLDAPERFAIAHCVSVCKKMSAGVAKTICEVYPENRDFRSGKLGDVGVCRTQGRTIYNLQTKPKFYNKPTFANFEVSVRNLRRKMDQRGDKYLAIPKIGCGRDLLKWQKVLPLIEEVFRGSDIQIRVFEFVE
jgi:hypothetical protein